MESKELVMTKKIDLNKSIYELTKEYPELMDTMVALGFTEITKKAMLHSVGKMMTISKGAKLKNISMMEIIRTLMAQGYEIVGEMPDFSMDSRKEEKNNRMDQIKEYLKRLGKGEELEKVRADFVHEFENVDASEIMQAEQELLKEGVPLIEVQQLCDIHSALFHGKTSEEKSSTIEKELDQDSLALQLESIAGHPLSILKSENAALSRLIETYKGSWDDVLLDQIRQVSIHYAKKGDLLYPLLKVRYDISGPSDVMWTVDDEIRDELASLDGKREVIPDWSNRMDALLRRMEEMIYKEENILFPICASYFTEEEWYGIYRDAKDYDSCFGVEQEKWLEAEKGTIRLNEQVNGEIVMPGGHLTLEQLTALLNTIPMEITFVDHDNINRFFNEGEKVFKRPAMAIDREVFTCHPPKIEPMVRQIIDDFRQGRRDFVSVWMEKEGKEMLVKYMAVRDQKGKYIGTVELVQDMEFAKEHFLGNASK